MDIRVHQFGEDAVRLQRTLPATIARVWEYLTTPELLGTWIADGEIEPRVGGRVALTQLRDALPINTGNTIRGIVTRWEPPHALAFSWQHDDEPVPSHVLFELSASGEDTVLTITHSSRANSRRGARREFAAGWRVHTDFMHAHMLGQQATPFMDAFVPLKAHYGALAEVSALYHDLLAAWNARDANAMANCFLPDGLSVGFDGSSMRGREVIETQLRAIWADHQTPAYTGLVQDVRLISDDVAVLSAVSGLAAEDAPEINAALSSMQAMTARNTPDGWRVALWQNTPAAFHGRDEDRDALTRELNTARTGDASAVERSVWIAAAPDQVWPALAEPGRLGQWLLPPTLGAQLVGDAAGSVSAHMFGSVWPVFQVEQQQANTLLKWRALPDESTRVQFTLDGVRGGTRVSVRVTGLDAFPEGARLDRVQRCGTSWVRALQNLRAQVIGHALPHPEGLVAGLFGFRREGGQAPAVERSIFVAAPRARVWRAVTDAKDIQGWFSPATAWRVTELRVGGRISVVSPETGADTYIQIIDVVDAPSRFVTRSDPDQPESMRDQSVWTLVDEGAGTRVTITNTNLLEMDAPTRHNAMEQTAFGWGGCLANLRAYVEGGVLPFPQGF